MRDEAAVLALLRLCGAPYVRVVFTRNRRIMASATGGTLRVHQAFAAAPDEVLDALVSCFMSRVPAKRSGARRVLRGFFAAAAAPEPPRSRTRTVRPAHLPHLARLEAEFLRVNDAFFAGALPTVPLFLSERMRRRNGQFSTNPPQIVIAQRLCAEALPGEDERTLRHEMIHLWQHHEGRQLDHGREFREWARRLDIRPRATRSVCWRDPS